MADALVICREALEKHKGGKAAYFQILEIIEDWSEEHEDDN